MMYRCFKLMLLFSLPGIAALLTGCNPEPPVRELRLNFYSVVTTTPEGRIRLELGTAAVGEMEEDPSFSGVWELREEDGTLRASGEVVELPGQIGEEVLVTWEGELAPGKYELTWGAPMYGGVVKLFEVLDSSGGIGLSSSQEEYYSTEFPPDR